MSDYNFTTDVVIGMEVHVELDTSTKIFCSCPTHSVNTYDKENALESNSSNGDEPNTRCCPVCLGHPGSKPVLNIKVLEYAIKLALAMKCDISKELIFSRKNYFYPDLSKNYQISQYELP